LKHCAFEFQWWPPERERETERERERETEREIEGKRALSFR
jgi:hypothetical protein